MSVKLRLRRMGRKKRPIYAVIAADSRNARDGRFIEDLGRYNVTEEPATITLKEDRVLYWLQQGAQPSDTVRNILSKKGLLLASSLMRKGKSEDEIQQAVEAHRALRAKKEAAGKLTVADRRKQALEDERKRAAEVEAKLRAEAEAEARRQADERRKAEEARATEAAAREAAVPEAPAEAPATEEAEG